MLEIVVSSSMGSQSHSIIVKVFQAISILLRSSRAISSLVSASVFFIVDCGIAASRKEESAEKIIAGEAAMSYRLRLLPAVSYSGHNFTGDSPGAVYSPWITREGGGGGMETGREFALRPLSLACRTSYLPDWKPPALLIPNKSVRRQPGTARPLHRARSKRTGFRLPRDERRNAQTHVHTRDIDGRIYPRIIEHVETSVHRSPESYPCIHAMINSSI